MRDLKTDLELCEKATPGPWEVDPGNEDATALVYYVEDGVVNPVAEEMLSSDAEFIAQAREALPYWLDRVVELEATVLHLQTVIKGVLAIINQSEGVAGWHLNGEIAKWKEFGYPKELEQALFSEAAKEMLERVRKLEEVACEAADVVADFGAYIRNYPQVMKLAKALAALDEEDE